MYLGFIDQRLPGKALQVAWRCQRLLCMTGWNFNRSIAKCQHETISCCQQLLFQRNHRDKKKWIFLTYSSIHNVLALWALHKALPRIGWNEIWDTAYKNFITRITKSYYKIRITFNASSVILDLIDLKFIDNLRACWISCTYFISALHYGYHSCPLPTE